MSNFVENITRMSEADLKAWCLQQVSSNDCALKRIAEADQLMSWIVSSQAASQCSSDDPQFGTTEERSPSGPKPSEIQNCYSQVPPSSTEQHPADSYSAGHTESVAISAEQQAELKEQDSHDWMEAFVIPFIKQLSGADLAAINAGVIPTPLMKMLGRVAYNEIERRRDA